MKNTFILFVVFLIYGVCIPAGNTFAGRIKDRTSKEAIYGKKAGAEAIPIEITKDGHILLKAKVNGREGNFILDTGAGINVLFKKFADEIETLKEEDGEFTGFRATGEEMTMKLYTAREINIGDLAVKNPTISILDANFGNVDGLISLTCFRNQPFTIDYKDKEIILESRKTLKEREKKGTVVPIQIDDQRGISLDIFTRVRVNDKLTLQIALDSGAGLNVFRFNEMFMKELGIDSSNCEKYYKRSSLNSNINNIFYKNTVSKIELYNIAAVKVANVKAFFLKGLIYDGITSINWLGNKITIDIPDKVMIVQ